MKHLIMLTGALVFSMLLLGCATPRQVAELRAQIDQLQNQLSQNNALLMADRTSANADSQQMAALKAQVTQLQDQLAQTQSLIIATRANPPAAGQPAAAPPAGNKVEPENKAITLTPDAMEMAELREQVSRLQSQLANVNALLEAKTEAPAAPAEPEPVTPTVAPPTFTAPPQTVVVTTEPEVQYITTAPNLFYYGNTWYYYDASGWWFCSYHHNGPWVVLDRRVVPPVFGRIREPYIRHDEHRTRSGGRNERPTPSPSNDRRGRR